MGTERKELRKLQVREYLKRLNHGRGIHRRLDDGALLALCEDYRHEEAPRKPKPEK